jgi:hypothetical protein
MALTNMVLLTSQERENYTGYGRTALALAGWLRVLREDVETMADKVLTGELTTVEALTLDRITGQLETDIQALRARLQERT